MKNMNINNNKNNLNINNINNSENNYNDIIIDKRMLPLFKTPVNLKILSDKRRNKYILTLKTYKTDWNFDLITFKDLLGIYLKGLNLYTKHLINYLKTHNNKELILQLKKDDFEKLNISISNYFYMVNKFMPLFKLRSLLYNFRLFLPKRLFKPEPYIRFRYRFRDIAKIYNMDLIFNNKRDRKILRRQINILLYKGTQIIKEIDTQIILKKKLIKKLNNKNNILKIIHSLVPTITEMKNMNINNNKNNLNINNSLKDSSILENKFYSNLKLTKESQPFQKKLNAKIEQTFENVKNNKNQIWLYEKKLLINKIFNPFNINKNNEIKIEQTLNTIFNNKEFESKFEGLYSNPVEIEYSNSIFNNINNNKNNLNINNINNSTVSNNLHNKNKPIINQYLKSMSPYNMVKKGIFMSYSNIIGFNFKTERNKLIKNIYKLLAGSFKSMYCLISKPVFVMTPDKIIIQLFYFLFIPNILKFKKFFKYGSRNKLSRRMWFKRKRRIKKQYRKFRKMKINVRVKFRKLSNVAITKVFKLKLKKICEILSLLFKKPVQLDLIRLHYPYNDSNILVNLLGIMINKIKLRIILRKLFEKAVIKNLNKVTGNKYFNIIPAFLSGIHIRVAGRLLTHRVIPRRTVKTIWRGAAATGKINFSDVARYTNKNKRGAFSITVSSGQNFF